MSMSDHVEEFPRSVLRAAQQGDRAAQSEIFSTYFRDIHRFLYRLTHQSEIADDLTQEVFIVAFAGLPRFRGDAKLKTWLFRIATNKAWSWWDSQKRRKKRESQALLSEGEEHCPEEHLETQRTQARLYESLERLPNAFRQAFVIRSIEGCSLKEASDILDVPISTVSYRCRRAEALLCEHLELQNTNEPDNSTAPQSQSPKKEELR